MSFSFELHRYGHLHQVLVSSHALGWRVTLKQDSSVVRQTYRDDWHKVERDVRLFQMRMFACGTDGSPVISEKQAA